jgi:Flp pilus assembly protein TadB
MAGPVDSRRDATGDRMGEPLQGKQTRLQILFLVALLGVLLALGVALASLAGPEVALGYGVLALALLCVGAARARAAQQRARSAAGRTCTCCTATQHDPVKVI